MPDSVTPQQRFTQRQPCPICNGHVNMPQGRGTRCFGFLSDDGEYAHCSREESAGQIEPDQASTYPHKLHGKCGCGVQHGDDPDERRPVNLSRHRERRTGEARRAPDIEYEYRDESGRVVGVKGRWNIPATVEGAKPDKDIAWRVPQGTFVEGLRKYGVSVDQMPLYNAHKLAQLTKGATVYFVEGEPAADACEQAGLVDWKSTGVTTNAGGSGQAKFGDSLDVLEGYHLRPWPDNDPQGRKLMRTLRPLLEHRVLSWRPVIVSVPENGDAYDFFYPTQASGYDPGTVEQIEHQALIKPITERLDEETIRVTVPSNMPDTRVVFTFSEIERQRRKLVCVVQTQVFGAGAGARKTLQYDIDLLSISAIDNYRKMLDKAYGQDHEWHDLLTTAVGEMRLAWSASTDEVDSADIDSSDGDELMMAIDRIVPWGEHTVVFGKRDSTKSYEVLTMVASASVGMPFAGLTTHAEGTWLYIDNETNERNWGRRMRRIWRSLGYEDGSFPRGRVLYKNARGRSLPDLYDDLKPRVSELGVVGIVVDSAILACGGDPLDPLAVAHYFAKCDQFGVTVITIAHIPKENNPKIPPPQDPFGSVVWSNKARATWRVDRQSQTEGDDRVNVKLVNCKGNDLQDKRPLFMEVYFEPDNGPVTVRQKRAYEAPRELQAGLPLISRIWNVLGRGPMTAYDIASVLNEGETMRVEAKTIKDTCHRHTLADARPRLVPLESSTGRGNQTRYARAEITGAPGGRVAVGQTGVLEEDDDIPI